MAPSLCIYYPKLGLHLSRLRGWRNINGAEEKLGISLGGRVAGGMYVIRLIQCMYLIVPFIVDTPS